MDDKQKAYEKRVDLLFGEIINQVVYCTYELGKENPAYDNYDGKFHWLDQGIVLQTQSGKVFSIVWGDEFDQYGLDFLTTEFFYKIDEGNKNEIWDLTNHKRWKDYIGHRVVATEVYWSWSAWDTTPDVKTFYPQDMAIRFDNGKSLYLSASQYVENEDRFRGWCDDVIVIFDDDIAKKYLFMFRDDLNQTD
jgi:hypothetical protein